jgi:S-disulfanyl-L-cysteine oxidoreductase SoxD
MRRALARGLVLLATALACSSGARGVDPVGGEPLPGRRPDANEVAAADITVFPDGTGLPAGRATAREGRGVYQQRCAACHGATGQGSDDYPALAGGVGSLNGRRPVLTVGSYWPHATTLWDYTRRAMPYPQPGSLTPTEVYAVTAYVLHLNGIVAEDTVLDRTSLPRIRMPNRDGFVPDPRTVRPLSR